MRLNCLLDIGLFGITFEFLRYFGLESLDNLPELDLPQIEFPHSANGTDYADSISDDNTANNGEIVDNSEVVTDGVIAEPDIDGAEG